MNRSSDSVRRILVAGIGSDHGDDQIGWQVAWAVQKLVGDSTDLCVRVARVPLDLLDWMSDFDTVHLCDAAQSPGSEMISSRMEVCRLIWHEGTLVSSENQKGSDSMLHAVPGNSGRESSHGFGLLQVLQLAEATGQLPNQVVVWSIAGDAFSPEDLMSARLAAVADRVAKLILEETAFRTRGNHADGRGNRSCESEVRCMKNH